MTNYSGDAPTKTRNASEFSAQLTRGGAARIGRKSLCRSSATTRAELFLPSLLSFGRIQRAPFVSVVYGTGMDTRNSPKQIWRYMFRFYTVNYVHVKIKSFFFFFIYIYVYGFALAVWQRNKNLLWICVDIRVQALIWICTCAHYIQWTFSK